MATERIASTIAAIVHRLTGRELEAADYQRSFFDWGADSLILIQLARLIETDLGARIPFRRFFGDLGTLAAIVDHLAAETAVAEVAVTEVSPAPAMASADGDELPASEDELVADTPVEAWDGEALREIVNRQLAVMEAQLAVLRQARGHAGTSVPSTTSHGRTVAATGAATPLDARVGAPVTRATAGSSQQQRPYVPYRPPDLSTAALSDRQRRYMDHLAERLGRRSSGSRACAARQRRVLADPRLMTGFRPMWKDLVYPLYVESAHGARIRDLDGHEYVDMCMGYGSYLFGHAPQFWTDAVQRAHAVPIGPQSELVGRVAELVTSLTRTERAAFFNSGTEAVMGALRAARTITGRQRIAMFAGAYHGWSDQVLAQQRPDEGTAAPSAPGVPPNAVADAHVLTYGSDAALAFLEREAGTLAAVLVEPVQSRRPDLQPIAFLRRVREITAASGTALIFDEMITGLRSAPAGVQELWTIRPDLTIYGKAVAGGLPIGVVAGRGEFMNAFDGGPWEYGDDSGPDSPMTFCAGTYFKHPLVMAGAEACLSHLQQRGPALQRDLNERVARWVDRLRARLEQLRLPVRVPAFSSLFRLQWDQPFPYAQLFYYALQDKGVFAWEGGNFFVSTAHSDADLDLVASAIEASLLELRSAGFLPPGSHTPTEGVPDAATSTESAVPLTPAQRDVWLSIEVGHASSEAYNECITLELHGDLDVAALASCVEQLAKRHEAFRTVFDRRGPTQTFGAPPSVRMTHVDLTRAAPEEASRLPAALRALVDDAFDFERGPLFRTALIRTARDRHVFALVFHHLILDNWSVGTVVRELPILYEASRRGVAARLPEPQSFAEYARAESEPQRITSAEAFWLERLRGVVSPPPRLPAEATHAGSETTIVCTRRLAADVFERLRAVAADAETTIVAAMLTAFQIFLHRATGRDDLVVGMPIAGQPFMGPETLVGYCLNVLPMRSHYDRRETFADAVRRVGAELAEALEHRTCSLGSLVERLAIPERGREHPLIAALFNYDVSGPPPAWPDLTVRPYTPPKADAKLPLEMNVSQEAGALEVELVASRGVTTASLGRWLDVFVQIVTEVARDAHIASGAVPLLNRSATERLLEWGTGSRGSRAAETLTQLTTHTAVEHPDRVAVVMANTHVTYGELRRRTRACAAYAQSVGVDPDVPVPICLERSIDMVVCVLGILEAGGAYVPIDPTLIPERIAWMLGDSRAPLVFVDASTAPIVAPLLPAHCRAEDVARASLANEPRPVPADPQRLAYVIYTSGSTGRPKGAMNAHVGVVNQLRWIQESLQLTADDRVLQKTSLSFDASVWELFWPLSVGATLVLASKDAQFDPAALHADLALHGVTTAIFVPSMLREVVALPSELSPALRRIGCIGEAVTPALAADVRRRVPRAQFWNFYGPTEVAVAVTAWRCDDEPSAVRRVPIGRAIANSHVYVADGRGDLVPAGAEGELYLGGLGVGRGYWNRPDLTAERFVPDEHGPPGARAYRTGDRVRYGADGQLEFIGRLDGQLKIRGYRIEIGEIESVMAQHPGVAEVAVWAAESDGDRTLAAAWTGDAREADVHAWLAARLPRYMVPASLVRVTSLPHLPNGKLDRNGLRLLRADAVVEERDESRSDPIESVVQGIWEHVLGRRVARTDSFVSAGGHSLQATQVINRIATTFGVTLAVRTLFEDTSVAALSLQIAASLRGGDTQPPVPVTRTELLPTATAQERFWLLEQLAAGTGACNLPLAVRIKGLLHVPALQAALDAVIARHEVLRTTFELTDDGNVCQRVAATRPAHWDTRAGDMSDALRWAQIEAKRRFDLARGPLVHSVLVAVGPDDWIWLLTLHHIAADAWSIQILWRELSTFYQAAVTHTRVELPQLPLQYGDFAVWQRGRLDAGALSNSLAYWRTQLADPPPPIRWNDRDTPVLPSHTADVSARVRVDSSVAASLARLVASAAVTQSMVVVAAMEIVVWSHTGQANFLVGVPIHGRTRSELEPLIGCFVNMLPVRARVRGDATFAELLADVRAKMLDAYAHSELPFEAAIADPNRAARSFVGLVVSTRNVPISAAPIPGLSCETFEAARPVSAHELLCEVGEAAAQGWSIDLTGSAELFSNETIARIGELLGSVLVDAAANPNRTVSSWSAPVAAASR